MAKKRSSIVTYIDDLQENVVHKSTNIRRRIIQNFHLIWFDPSNARSNDASIDQLQTIFQMIHKFNDVDQCIDFMTDIQSEQVFLIISNNRNENLISLIHDIPQLDSIYIYNCSERSICEEGSKIKGVFQQETSLIESLRQKTRQCDQNSISISIISSDVKLDQNLDQLDPTFIYTQMLKEILLEVKYNKQSIDDLAEYFRTLYFDNQITLNAINRFKQTYNNRPAIWWYSSEIFIYTVLNRALRTLEVDTIIKIGVFIHDLHWNIIEMYKKQKNQDESRKFTVYRGQGLAIKHFQKILKSPGGLVSFNNFLSTSHDRDVSLMFAQSVVQDPNLIGVLFQMEIDTSSSSALYAHINDISQYESEDETLFSMNTIFRIGEIKSLDDTNRFWQVNLTITRDTDQELKALADHLREETKNIEGWFRLVPLLIRLGEFEKAKQLCETLLPTAFEHNERANIYNQLGYIHDNLSDYRQAISSYEKALEIISRFIPLRNQTLAATFNNIGSAYLNLGELKTALLFFEKSLEVYKAVLPPNHAYFGTIYNNIGLVYDNLGDQSKALDFYEKSIGFKDTLPKNHPGWIITYKNLSFIHKEKGDYRKALTFIKKALELEQKSLPEDHPSFSLSYNHIGGIYRSLGEYAQAVLYYEKAIEISRKSYGEIHDDVATGYNNISSLHIEMGEYSKAASEGEKAIEIGKQIFDKDHIALAKTYNTIGLAYCHLAQYSKAFQFCQKSIDIYEKTPDRNPLDLANSYNGLGGIYTCKWDFKNALEFFEKGRSIQESILPSGHFQLANTYANIGQAYFAMKDHIRGLFFSGKGLIICRKTLPQYHPELITSYISVAGPLLAMHQRSAALSAYQHAVEIAQHSLPVDDQRRKMCERMYELLKI